MNPYLAMGTPVTGGGKPSVPAGLRYVHPETREPANLPAFGGLARSGSRRLSSDPVFNREGEINASSVSEALTQIKYVLDSLHDGSLSAVPEFSATASNDPQFAMSAEEKTALVMEALQDHRGEGFEMLGQTLVNPVKEVLDYEGFARRCLPLRNVRQGETVRYDKDVFTTAFTVGEDAQTPEIRVGGKYIFAVPKRVSQFVTISLEDIYQAGYDILARTQDRARQAVEKEEDEIFRAQIDEASTAVNDVTYFATLNLAALEAIRKQIEQNRIPADKLLINRDEVSDLTTVLSAEVDPITQRELVMGGFIGMILNMAIITSAGRNTFEVIRPGEVYALTAPEFLGGFPVWVELFSEPTTGMNEGKPVRGWFWWELISMLIINAAGVAKGVKV